MTGMENVLAAHGAMASTSDFPAGTHVTCMCDWTYRTHSDHATHVAAALSAAGFGNLHDAWAEGAKAVRGNNLGWYYVTGELAANPYPKVSET